MPPYVTRGSWYSQLPPFGWFDKGDRPGSNALGVPDWQQGIALPSRGTLGQWYNVTPPGETIPYPFQQTDTGPAPWTGRGVDISAAAAHQMGYTPKTFPTDAQFKVEPRDEPRGLGSPAGLPVQAGDLPDNAPGDTAYASGPPPPGARKSMPDSLWDMFQPRSAVDNQPIGYGDAIAQNRNALVGFGMGMLQPRSLAVGAPVGSAMTDALGGYMQGARADSANAYRQALLAHTKQQEARQAAQDLFQRHQAGQQQSNWERTFKASQEVKPSIHWTADRTDEKGDTIPGMPFLVNPNGSYRPLTLEGAQNLSGSLPQTGAVPGAPATASAPGPQTSADETAIPPAAAEVQATPAPALPLNRREAIKQYSHETGKNVAATAEREKVGSGVLKMIDSLEGKTKDPLFAEAAGPAKEYASGQPVWNPARAVYEYTPLGPSEKAKTHLDTVKSDAQAINSELQRAYLSGQGSVTENERAQISQILGNIAAARSPEAARTMLDNLRGIVTTAFQRGYAVPGATGPNETPKTPAPKTSSEPDPRAVKFLRAYPNRAQEFDAKYGPGSAARYLNEM